MPLSRQEIFDIIVIHLRTQGKKSIDEEVDQCSYRNEDGSMCAIGCLLTDEEYHIDLEGRSVITLLHTIPSFANRMNADAHFLSALQVIHDHYDVELWEQKFQEFAITYGVTYTPKV